MVLDQNIGDLFSIYNDSDGNLWGGDADEFIKIDTKSLKHIRFDVGKPVRAIHEDKHKNIWLGTEGRGLILFDKKNMKVKKNYSVNDGLCNNAVLNILEDDNENLWLSTFNGLSKFDPKNNKFVNFYKSDGLQSSQFSYNAAIKLNSGEMAFGGTNGFDIFFPQNIVSRTYMPNVAITSILINNKQISSLQKYKIHEENNNTFITVPFKESFISIAFAALEYSTPQNIKYAYILEGWDNTWNYTQSRSVTYNNIKEGSYTFRVKSTNASGEWNNNETTIQIKILPPWYRSWWAYLLYLLILIFLIRKYLKYKSKQEALKYEIKLAQINAENEKELSEKKASFFTNISHELRTMLTLIINPIRMMTKNNDSQGETIEEANIVYKNAKRMLKLVDQLLLLRKTDVGNEELKISKENLYVICKDVFDSFTYQAKEKNIEYYLNTNNENIEIYIDVDKIEIVLFNLLSNAIKYTPEKGKITLKITENQDIINIFISDSGPGFSEEDAKYIFNKYFQLKKLESKSKPGFGIGLYLVKTFVDKHKGNISYETEKGKGTTFSITLLKGKEHLQDQYLINQSLKTKENIGKEVYLNDVNISEGKGKQDVNEEFEKIISDRHTILLVDDDKDFVHYLKSILRKKFNIQYSYSVKDAMEKIKKDLPNLIISDLSMHEIQGDEFCYYLKKESQYKHIPFILLTAMNDDETRLRCVKSGADVFVSKPFDENYLFVRIDNLLKTQSNLQEHIYEKVTQQVNNVNISEEDKDFLEKCTKVVQNHLQNDQFSISILADDMNMSHSNLYKKIKKVSGYSVNNFVRFIRLKKAAEMMIKTNMNINEIAYSTGFKDMKYFRTQFSKMYDITPSEYIKRYRKPLSKKYKINK